MIAKTGGKVSSLATKEDEFGRKYVRFKTESGSVYVARIMGDGWYAVSRVAADGDKVSSTHANRHGFHGKERPCMIEWERIEEGVPVVFNWTDGSSTRTTAVVEICQ